MTDKCYMLSPAEGDKNNPKKRKNLELSWYRNAFDEMVLPTTAPHWTWDSQHKIPCKLCTQIHDTNDLCTCCTNESWLQNRTQHWHTSTRQCINTMKNLEAYSRWKKSNQQPSRLASLHFIIPLRKRPAPKTTASKRKYKQKYTIKPG